MAEIDFRASYDAGSDVMYTSIGDPQRCDCSEDTNIIWRFSLNDRSLAGATIIGYKEMGIDMSDILSKRFNIPSYIVSEALNRELNKED